MQHLPVALLLAFCALFTGVLAQDAVPVDSDACYIRIDAFPGSTSCGGEKYCAYAWVNETQCGSLRLGSTSYSTKANCTAHTFALYESADCSGNAATIVGNNACERVASTAFSIYTSFDKQCSSAASMQSWISYFLF
jgi:hypothetical protein